MSQSDDPLDYIVLAGVRSPGLAVVSGASSPRTWDKKKGTGTSGATLTYTGDDLSSFTVTVILYDEEDDAGWEAFRPILRKAPKGEKAKAMTIEHPDLAELDIVSVVIEDVSQCKRALDGARAYEIKFSQYREPTPSMGKPKGSSAQSGSAGENTPKAEDEIDKMISALTQQVKELNA